jgi:hypothetical protein
MPTRSGPPWPGDCVGILFMDSVSSAVATSDTQKGTYHKIRHARIS